MSTFNPELQPQITIACVSNVYSRMMHFVKKGDTEFGHKHPFDHVTLLARGSVAINYEGKITEFKAPKMIFIRKEKEHELVALEDDTLAFCIHALRNGVGEGDIIDPDSIPEGVDPLSLALPLVCGTCKE